MSGLKRQSPNRNGIVSRWLTLFPPRLLPQFRQLVPTYLLTYSYLRPQIICTQPWNVGPLGISYVIINPATDVSHLLVRVFSFPFLFFFLFNPAGFGSSSRLCSAASFEPRHVSSPVCCPIDLFLFFLFCFGFFFIFWDGH